MFDRIIFNAGECSICQQRSDTQFDAGDGCSYMVPICLECLQRAVEEIKSVEAVV